MNYNKNSTLDVKISYICQREYGYFFNKKGVLGVALGYKKTRGFSTFKKCITVFVKKKLPCNIIAKENIIPICYKGIITDVVECDIFKFDSLTSRIRPVINGYSIGNLNAPYSGTCGCLVHDKNFYILSCNHILAMNNTAPKDSIILQPGTSDKGTTKDSIIGHLSKFIPIKFQEAGRKPENIVDCALCKVLNKSFVSSQIAFVGTPYGVSEGSLNEKVKKVGKTTELTYGKISYLSATIEIYSPIIKKFSLFKNQIITTKMSQGGDSGAVLLNHYDYVLGLLMGSDSQTSLYNPIEEVLKELKVELVTS